MSVPATLTLGLQHYSNEVLKALPSILVTIQDFARNFSRDLNAGPGNTVHVPYVKAGTAGDYNATSNNFGTATEDDLQGVSITLDPHKIIKFTVTPEMVADFQPAHWNRKAELDAIELAATIQSIVFGLPISDAITQTATVDTVEGAMTFKEVIQLERQSREMKLLPEASALYLTPLDYYSVVGSLTHSIDGTGSAIRQGNLGGLKMGFKAIYCLPPESTTSFIAQPDLILIGSKPYVGVQTGPRGDIIREVPITDPNSGLTMMETVVNSSSDKKMIHNLDIWFGAEVGNPDCGIKIQTASAS